MEIHDATELPSRAVTQFDSLNANWTAVARSDGACHLGRMRIGARGVVGMHPTRLDQLFIVVNGHGWVRTADGPRRGVSAGHAVLWRAGEEHESGTDSGMTAIVAQASQLVVGE